MKERQHAVFYSHRIVGPALLLLLFAAYAMAADPTDYQRRVNSAQSGVITLINNIRAEGQGESPDEPTEEVVAELRRLLPATENIETSGGTIATSNEWFAEGIDTVEAETDMSKKAAILNGLNDRLLALSERLDEMTRTAASERSKDEDKRKLDEILSRPEYQKTEQEQSKAGELLERILRWFESWFPNWSPNPSAPPSFGPWVTVLQYVLIGVVAGAILYGLYRLARIWVPKRAKDEAKEKTDRVILGERLADDATPQDLFSEADRLARDGDMRGAIRKGYIALLFELSEKKLIGLARYKTNRDYLSDLKPHRETFGEVKGLTGLFEDHWYGSRAAAADDWERFKNACSRALGSN